MFPPSICANCCIIANYIELGIPDKLMEENNMAKRLRPAQVPTAEEAVSLYEQSGGTLTLFGDFGIDPVEDHQQEQRLQMFQQRFPSYEPLFHRLVNGDNSLFTDAVLCFKEVTFSLS